LIGINMRLILLAMPFLFILTSCSSALKVHPVSSEYRIKSLKYFVQNNYEVDQHGLGMIIAGELRNKGYDVSNGFKKQKPSDTNILIVYDDQWQWDITDYLLHMRIDLRDPQTNILLDTGSSYQSSAARLDKRLIIRNIISNMFID